MKQAVLCIVLLAGLISSSCGGSSSPAGPGPQATPTPSNKPTPAPTPTPEPAGLSCTVPPIPDPGPCLIFQKAKKPNFLSEVIGAIDTLKKERKDLFTYSGKDGKIVTVTNPNQYYKGVVKILERDFGLCAAYKVDGLPRDEISVKNSNDFSEQYDILTGTGQVWWSWTVTCRPPVF